MVGCASSMTRMSVMVGTAADRFTIKVPADESWWVATRLRAELIKRELATAADLPMDEAGEAAMAAKAAAKARASATKAAAKTVKVAEAAKTTAAVALNAARYHEAVAGPKRRQAEVNLELACTSVKLAKALPVVSALAQQLPEIAPEAAPIQAKLESFFRRGL